MGQADVDHDAVDSLVQGALRADERPSNAMRGAPAWGWAELLSQGVGMCVIT